jgi:muramoyltetrapeptide carboxypeptidase LdcA involved in peptidoglycan recycling
MSFFEWFETNSASPPIVAAIDFGHTDPFFVLPYGVKAEIDCDARTCSIVESAVVRMSCL